MVDKNLKIIIFLIILCFTFIGLLFLHKSYPLIYIKLLIFLNYILMIVKLVEGGRKFQEDMVERLLSTKPFHRDWGNTNVSNDKRL